MSGSTKNTRLVGSAYLYPHVIPDPYTNTVILRHDDEFIIIANRGLWKYVGYSEAVEEIYEIGNPVVASKKLQDLAQGYGSKENIGILVIRLNTDSRPSLWRLRPKNQSMSIDDMEAAQQHQARKIAEVHPKMRASTGRLSMTESECTIVQVVTGTEEQDEPDTVNVDEESVKTEDAADDKDDETVITEAMGSETLTITVTEDGNNDQNLSDVESPRDSEENNFIRDAISIEGSPRPAQKSSHKSPSHSQMPALKPLPHQRFRRAGAAGEWEAVLQKRLMDDVKSKEMKLSVSQILKDSEEGAVSIVDIDPSVPSGYVSISRKRGMQIKNAAEQRNNMNQRLITPPWAESRKGINVSTANPAYSSYNNEPDESEIINMTSKDKKPKVRKTIMMFENIHREHIQANARATHVRQRSLGREEEIFWSPSQHDQNTTPVAGVEVTHMPRSGRPRSMRSLSLDLSENDIRELPQVKYNKEAGSHSTVISIPGGTVTSSNTDTHSDVYELDRYSRDCDRDSHSRFYGTDQAAFATVKMVKQHQNEREAAQNGYTSGNVKSPVDHPPPDRQSSYEENITVVEIARL